MKKIKLCVGDLVEDMDVYPRESVDSTHIGHISDAIASGATMPLIVIDAASKRIVDGFHRRRALLALYGAGHEIEVWAVKYDSEAELFADAMRKNSAHGNNITPYDRARCLLIGERLGLEPCKIADALHITTDRLEQIRATRLGNPRRKQASSASGESIPLKFPVRHMAGQTLTAAQVSIMPDLGGNNQAFYANQLIKLIETGLLDTGNERLMERLAVLRDKLDELL